MEPTNLGFNNIIKDFLLYLADSEKKLETQRLKLQKVNNFTNDNGYFNYLDKNCKNYVDLSDLSSFLNIFNIRHSETHLKQIIKKYDLNKDHCWNYDEFKLFTQPKKLNNLSNLSSFDSLSEYNFTFGDNKYIKGIDTTAEYEKELANLFQLEISILNHIAIKVRGIKNIPNNTGKLIDVNTVYKFILSKSNANKIDLNCLNFFLCGTDFNSSIYNTELILKKYGNNKELTLKQMEDFFTYDSRFIVEEDITYKRTPGYYKTNPVDYSEALYYNVYQQNKKKYQDLGYYSLRGSDISFKNRMNELNNTSK